MARTQANEQIKQKIHMSEHLCWSIQTIFKQSGVFWQGSLQYVTNLFPLKLQLLLIPVY